MAVEYVTIDPADYSADDVGRLARDFAGLSDAVEDAVKELRSRHRRDPYDMRLCECGDRWPCTVEEIAQRLEEALP